MTNTNFSSTSQFQVPQSQSTLHRQCTEWIFPRHIFLLFKNAINNSVTSLRSHKYYPRQNDTVQCSFMQYGLSHYQYRILHWLLFYHMNRLHCTCFNVLLFLLMVIVLHCIVFIQLLTYIAASMLINLLLFHKLSVAIHKQRQLSANL